MSSAPQEPGIDASTWSAACVAVRRMHKWQWAHTPPTVWESPFKKISAMSKGHQHVIIILDRCEARFNIARCNTRMWNMRTRSLTCKGAIRNPIRWASMQGTPTSAALFSLAWLEGRPDRTRAGFGLRKRTDQAPCFATHLCLHAYPQQFPSAAIRN